MSESKNQQQQQPEEEDCVVCFKNVDIYSFGLCDHPVCFECSTRMRVLCKQTECPICRQDMAKVIFAKAIQPYSEIARKFESTNLQDRKVGIIFCTSDIQKSYWQLLEHRCSICDLAREEKKTFPFRQFDQLKDHMRREHSLQYCDLCVDNLKIFTFERKCYNRQQLALHRRKGDPDNKSHRGHPLCEFCETRFMDNDDLFRHMRRTHMFCHFCDADGRHSYYSNLNELKHHFRQDHFFCEEGECAETPLTAVFRTDIDLQGHVAREHSRHLGKAAGKQARTLDIEFTLAPRPTTSTRRGEGHNNPNTNLEPGEVTPEIVQVNQLGAENFPPLSGPNKTPQRLLTKVNFTSVVKKHGGSFASTTAPGGPSREQFPALGGASASGSSTVRLSMNPPESRQVSIQVKHKPNGAISTHIRTSAGPSATTNKQTEAFPALGKSSKVSQPQWVPAKPPKKQQEPKNSKVAPAPMLPPSDLQQFPPLSGQPTTSSNGTNSTKGRKTSSVHVPVSQPSTNSDNAKKSNKQNKKKDPNSNNTGELNNNNSTNNQVKMRSELKIGTLSTPKTTMGPPPGFTNANFPALGSNNMTFTNSTGQSYAIRQNVDEYTNPPNFSLRNHKLISNCQTILSENSMKQFKKDSAMFRGNSMNAKRYYDRCKVTLGENFDILFPELLVLLPDIGKQQELFDVHSSKSKNQLERCVYCKQIVLRADKDEHFAHHQTA